MNIKKNGKKILFFLSIISQLSICSESDSQEVPIITELNLPGENSVMPETVTVGEEKIVEEKENNTFAQSLQSEQVQVLQLDAKNSQPFANGGQDPIASSIESKKIEEQKKDVETLELVKKEIFNQIAEIFTLIFIEKSDSKLREEFFERIALAEINKMPESINKHLNIMEIKEKLSEYGKATVLGGVDMRLKLIEEKEKEVSKEALEAINKRILESESKIKILTEKTVETSQRVEGVREEQVKAIARPIVKVNNEVEKILTLKINTINAKQEKFKKLCLYALAGCVVTFTFMSGYLYYIMMKKLQKNNNAEDDQN